MSTSAKLLLLLYMLLPQLNTHPQIHSNHVEPIPLFQSVSSIDTLLNCLLTKSSPASFLTTFLRSQFTTLPYPNHSFRNQTVIITGANTGLGLEAARHFVRLGAAKVILACRSLDKGFNAKKDIEHSFVVDPSVIEVWEVDVGNWESVRAFCKRVEGLERVDCLVENAGVATPRFEIVEGCEKTVAVNVIGTFLMALLVLPKLRETVGRFNVVPRLTIVASDAHEQVCPPFLFSCFRFGLNFDGRLIMSVFR